MANKSPNLSNLKPFKKGDKRTIECCKKSNKVQKENNLWKKSLAEGIRSNMTEKDWNEITKKLIERAKTDNKAFEVLRDTIGEKPTDRVEATIEQPTFVDDLDD